MGARVGDIACWPSSCALSVSTIAQRGRDAGIAGDHARAQFAHHVQRAAGVFGEQAQEDVRGNAQRAHCRLRAHRSARGVFVDDAHFALQLVAAHDRDDELALPASRRRFRLRLR